jgi:hypothetical protein
LPTGSQAISGDYQSAKKAAKDRIVSMVGREVTVGSQKSGNMKWKVIHSLEPSESTLQEILDPTVPFGLKELSLSKLRRSEVLAHVFLTALTGRAR